MVHSQCYVMDPVSFFGIVADGRDLNNRNGHRMEFEFLLGRLDQFANMLIVALQLLIFARHFLVEILKVFGALLFPFTGASEIREAKRLRSTSDRPCVFCG